VAVALWREWRAMLHDLQKVGPVWSIVRNERCVLAVQGNYPELTFSADERAARAVRGDSSLFYQFDVWREALACDTTCCCGRVYGVEFGNRYGDIFHKICLAKGTELSAFIDWTQVHQATGLELPIAEEVENREGRSLFNPLPAPGTLLLPAHLLRTVLICAAEREIPLEVAVSAEGLTQTARVEITRASESHGWLVFSSPNRSLYVESEPAEWLRVEPGVLEGESIWMLSLVDEEGRCHLRVHTGLDTLDAWNRLVQERVLVT